MQSIDVDAVEIIDSVECPGGASIAIIGNVRLGEEIDNVGSRIDHRRANDANGVGDVSATDVGLQKGRVDLA